MAYIFGLLVVTQYGLLVCLKSITVLKARSRVNFADSISEHVIRIAFRETNKKIDRSKVQTKSLTSSNRSVTQSSARLSRKVKVFMGMNPSVFMASYNSLINRSSIAVDPIPISAVIRCSFLLSNVNNSSFVYVRSVLVGFLEVLGSKNSASQVELTVGGRISYDDSPPTGESVSADQHTLTITEPLVSFSAVVCMRNRGDTCFSELFITPYLS